VSNTCNRVTKLLPPGISSPESREIKGLDDEWVAVYLENETFIETGSAYFAQAFADAASLIADVELHDLGRGRLRIASMGLLLNSAIGAYERSLELDEITGLSAHHADRLREAGVDGDVVRDTLESAVRRGMLAATDGRASVAEIYETRGYVALMTTFLDQVREIRDFVDSVDLEPIPATDAECVAWQEFSWSITARMSQTLAFGQAIAMVNTLTLRLLSASAN